MPESKLVDKAVRFGTHAYNQSWLDDLMILILYKDRKEIDLIKVEGDFLIPETFWVTSDFNQKRRNQKIRFCFCIDTMELCNTTKAVIMGQLENENST